jgi:hypothetical protein
MKTYEDVAKEAACKVYKKLCRELAEVAGVPAPRASTRTEEFQIVKDVLVRGKHDSQKMTKMLAEQIIRAGGHPRFPRDAE